MKRIPALLLPLLVAPPPLASQDEEAEWPAPRLELAPAAGSWAGAEDDAVGLRDGSFLKGEALALENNVFQFRTARGEKLEINWAHVVALKSSKTLAFVMSDGTRFSGTVRPGDLRGSLWVRTAEGEELNVPIRLITGQPFLPIRSG